MPPYNPSGQVGFGNPTLAVLRNCPAHVAGSRYNTGVAYYKRYRYAMIEFG